MQQRKRSWFPYWFTAYLVLMALLVVPDVMSEPTTGQWIQLGLLVFGAACLIGSWIISRKNGHSVFERIDPASVPDEDIEAVVSESGRTVTAIRSLRQEHPGLGLKDARDLVMSEN